MYQTPIPKELPLPYPAPELTVIFVLILFFVLHIVFVNLMVGGTIMTLLYEIKGKSNTKYLDLSKMISKTITVNKSIAVVLGVGPLLCINLIYTVYFYSANALTGYVWISIVPLVIIAFLATYLHKYTWDIASKYPNLHIFIIVIPVVIFLFVPLIFLANINLMLFPDKWSEVVGFVSALKVGNPIARYFHFLTASMALTGLFIVWISKRKSENDFKKEISSKYKRTDVIRIGYKWCFFATLLQFLFGPIVLLTLPEIGFTPRVIVTILFGALLGLASLIVMLHELKRNSKEIGKSLYLTIIMLFCTIMFMATGRHMYRQDSLSEHKQKVQEKTKQYNQQLQKYQQSK